ncbi:MAG: molybdate ABC transporter substrate-binding protein [Candidatus Wallbacteria bacterium]
MIKNKTFGVVSLCSAAMVIFIILMNFSSGRCEDNKIIFLAGSASKPAVEELVKEFEKESGIKVDVSFGGSGVLLSQMKISKAGDLYFPGSVDFIEKAKRENLIDTASETQVVYLVPSINVKRGNPKGIKTLKDLCKPGLKVVIGNPDCVCLGVFAVELFEKYLDTAELKLLHKNIVNYAESCEKTATSISLGAADAIIGWSVFESWDAKRIETVPLSADNIVRLSYLSIAITKYAKNPALAQKLIDYIKSEKGLKFFKKYNYFITPEEALKFVGAKKPIGGVEYIVPREWMLEKK